VYFIGKRSGTIVNYKEISKNLVKDQRTIANYFEYLEFGLLIKRIFYYRGSPMASARKLKRAYFTTPNIAFAFNQNLDDVLPFMLENLIATKIDAQFFYRNSFEIDFVIPVNGKLDAIEVKKNQKDTIQIKKFREKFEKKAGKSIIIDLEKEITEDITVIPAWKFLLDIG